MSEFEDKLNHILNDEAAMGQIMSLARAISGEGDSNFKQDEQPQVTDAEYVPVELPEEGQGEVPPPQQAGKSSGIDWSAMMQMLGSMSGGGQKESDGQQASEGNPFAMLENIDPRMLQLGMRIFSEYNRTDDKKTALLLALRPFVKEERYAKVDRAVQIARLSRVIRVAFDVFRENRENGGREGA